MWCRDSNSAFNLMNLGLRVFPYISLVYLRVLEDAQVALFSKQTCELLNEVEGVLSLNCHSVVVLDEHCLDQCWTWMHIRHIYTLISFLLGK